MVGSAFGGECEGVRFHEQDIFIRSPIADIASKSSIWD
jgi:hypothetical protein